MENYKLRKIVNLKEFQQISTYMLKQLMSICEEYNIRVYLLGGTLLGAVRHKGFIPWDDDIDLCMSRPAYEKLCKINNGNLSDELEVIDPATNKEFKGIVPIVAYKNSKFIPRQYRGPEIHKIGLSIFVFDGAPVGELNTKLYYKKMYILRAEHALCRANFKNVTTRIAKIVGPILSPFFSEKDVFKFKKKVLDHQKKYRYEDSKYVSNNADSGSMNEIMLKSVFEDAHQVEFEGLTCYAFGNYKEFLTKYYGDFMQLPPIEEQVQKHGIEAWIDENFFERWERI